MSVPELFSPRSFGRGYSELARVERFQDRS